jgi:prophage regulatory protein
VDEIERPTKQTGIEPRLLTLEDVATYLSVSVAQVYALVRSGGLTAVKIGGRGIWRVDRRQLDAYVDRLHEEALARGQVTAGRKEDG